MIYILFKLIIRKANKLNRNFISKTVSFYDKVILKKSSFIDKKALNSKLPLVSVLFTDFFYN